MSVLTTLFQVFIHLRLLLTACNHSISILCTRAISDFLLCFMLSITFLDSFLLELPLASLNVLNSYSFLSTPHIHISICILATRTSTSFFFDVQINSIHQLVLVVVLFNCPLVMVTQHSTSLSELHSIFFVNCDNLPNPLGFSFLMAAQILG